MNGKPAVEPVYSLQFTVHRWRPWFKCAQLCAGLRGHGIPKPIEPGTGVEILSSGSRFLQYRSVGVPHDQESNTRLLSQKALGPLPLPSGCSAQFRLIHCMIAEHRAEEIDQSKPQIRMQNPVGCGCSRMLNDPMDQLGLPARLGQPIAVNRGDRAIADGKRRSMRVEGQAKVSFPEIAIPPIMISSDHHDRQLTPKPCQCGGDMESSPRNHPRVGKPEVEQVAIDEQAVAQRRHLIQEFEKCLFDSGRRHSEVGIGHYHEGAAEHGAKDGLPFSWVQPASSRCQQPTPERLTREASMATSAPSVSETIVRVNYSETDQMGVVYHARYLVWLDVARCDYLRHSGMSYRELELAGLRLAVSEVAIRYRQPAYYDDVVRIRCWVRDVASRRVDFGYGVERAGEGRLLATASTSLLALDHTMSLTRLPDHVRQALRPIPDPIKLG